LLLSDNSGDFGGAGEDILQAGCKKNCNCHQVLHNVAHYRQVCYRLVTIA